MPQKSGPELIVVGCDPGPMCGILAIPYITREDLLVQHAMPRIIQCDADSGMRFLEWLIKHYKRAQVIISYETFVINHRAGRTRNRHGGTVTSKMGGAIEVLADPPRVSVSSHRMVDIAEWASDRRLEVAGLLAVTIGMKHTRAAARHALYASRIAGVPDPLSKRYRNPVEADAS